MGPGVLRRSSRSWAALAATVATLLMLAAPVAARTPAFAATRTLSPAEESAIPTADPSHIIPDVIHVQFSRPVSSAELASFEGRFHLTYISDLEIGDGLPYYTFHIDDCASPPDKRVQILAGEPLVSLCEVDIRIDIDAGRSASNQSPTGSPSPSPTTSPVAAAPLGSLAPTSSARPSEPTNPDRESNLPPATIALIVVMVAVACLFAAAVFVRWRRRAR
jgi:hypothetical protein